MLLHLDENIFTFFIIDYNISLYDNIDFSHIVHKYDYIVCAW